jgi:hypothetical protein
MRGIEGKAETPTGASGSFASAFDAVLSEAPGSFSRRAVHRSAIIPVGFDLGGCYQPALEKALLEPPFIVFAKDHALGQFLEGRTAPDLAIKIWIAQGVNVADDRDI